MCARNSLSYWVLWLERQILSGVPFDGSGTLSACALVGMLIQSFLLVRTLVACILRIIRTVGRTCGGGILCTLLGPLDLFPSDGGIQVTVPIMRKIVWQFSFDAPG